MNETGAIRLLPAWCASGWTRCRRNPLLARVNPALGPRLLALGCHLVWATTWMDEANECVSPLLGLPALPVVTWPDFPEDGHGWSSLRVDRRRNH